MPVFTPQLGIVGHGHRLGKTVRLQGVQQQRLAQPSFTMARHGAQTRKIESRQSGKVQQVSARPRLEVGASRERPPI